VLIVGEAAVGGGTEGTLKAGVFGEHMHGAMADATLACVVAKDDGRTMVLRQVSTAAGSEA
jgi:hypothetical protein